MTELETDKLIDAALPLIAQHGWHGVDISMVCEKAEVPNRVFRRHFGTMSGLVEGCLRRLNDAVFGAARDLEPEDSVRDRLFELLFARLDAAANLKPALVQLERGLKSDPALAVAVVRAADQAMDVVLEQAGLDSSGLRGRARRGAVMALAYGPALRAWLTDDSDDLGPTMRALDKGMGRLGRFLPMSARPGADAA